MISYKSVPNVVVGGLGAATPIGRTAWSAAAAVRAGVPALANHPFMVDSEGEPMRVAQCPWLAGEPRLENRLADCLRTAIRGALAPLSEAREGARRLPLMLWVNLPPARPGMPPSFVAAVETMVRDAFKGVFVQMHFAQLGHAGGFVALSSAIQVIESDRRSACVIAGVDSYLEPDTLEWLEETDQLHGAGPRNNAWGFIPGEAAGAVLVVAGDVAKRDGIKSLGQLLSLGLARETKLIRTPDVCLGRGLTAAFRDAFGGLPAAARVTDVYCDMNGETYRADEFGFAVIVTRERFVGPSEFVAPADCWGDVGAASAPLAMLLACIASVKGYAKGQLGLVWASSETGERGAVVIQAAGEA